MEEFFLEHPSLKGPCAEAAQQVDLSCREHMQQEMLKAQQNMLATLETNKVLKMMAEFYQKKETQTSLFKFVRHYIDGNFGFNKNQIPFCATGVDHDLPPWHRMGSGS